MYSVEACAQKLRLLREEVMPHSIYIAVSSSHFICSVGILFISQLVVMEWKMERGVCVGSHCDIVCAVTIRRHRADGMEEGETRRNGVAYLPRAKAAWAAGMGGGVGVSIK
jgi:hypothetical protein